jgi:SAM-dependent methyltransferase
VSRYDPFAQYYDQVIGDRSEVAKLLMRLIRRHAPRARTVLELGCGSGTMLQELSRRYETTGIDNSRAMLKLARKKCAKAELLFGDISEFSLDRQFDVVVCPFDTINHVTSFRAWQRVFENAHAHLRPGGAFIFDVNTEHKMEMYRADPVTVDFHSGAFSTVSVRRLRRWHYQVDLTLFREVRSDLFRRYQMSLPELVVPTQKILSELSSLFRRVTLLDPDRRRPTAETEELFFICSAPR